MTNKTEPTALERLKTAQNDKAELLLISQETLGQIIASLEREAAARDERDAQILKLLTLAVGLETPNDYRSRYIAQAMKTLRDGGAK